jgi:hypothetical protein
MIKTPDPRARIITKKIITVIVISYISISVYFVLKIELLATGQLGIGLMFLIYKMHRTYLTLLTGCQLSDKPYACQEGGTQDNLHSIFISAHFSGSTRSSTFEAHLSMFTSA